MTGKLINIEQKAHASNATQNIHPLLMQDTHTYTTAPTASPIHLKIHERHTQNKDEDRSTTLARSVEVTYYWGPKPDFQCVFFKCLV